MRFSGPHIPTSLRRVAVVLALVMLATASWAADSMGPRAAAPAPPTSAAPVPAVRQADNLAVITIRGEINAVTARSFARRLAEAENQGADAIVIELDTPGGELGAVREITSELRNTSLYTIAWINDDAISGGSIIAIAADEIVMAPNATFGDSGIVLGGGAFHEGLKPTERAKVMSILISEVVESARANGYDEVLVQGLAALGVETWRVRDARTGRDYFLTEAEYMELFDKEPPRSAQALVGAPGLARSAEDGPFYADAVESGASTGGADSPAFEPDAPDFTPQMKREISSAVTTASTRPDFRNEDPANYTYIGRATDGNLFLTLKGTSIIDFGFARDTIANDQELMQYTGAKHLARLNQSWSEHVVDFMTQGMTGIVVRAILIVVFLLGLFIELSMPGVGVAGLAALLAFAGLVVPPLLINASAWWTIVAILVGVALILTEVFITPGFGLPGISGLILLLMGLIGTFAPAGQLFPGTGPGSDSGLAWAASVVVLSIFAAGAGAYLISRYTQHVPIANKLVLTSEQRLVLGRSSTMLGAMSSAPENTGAAPVGAVGVAITRLMPSGAGDFDGQLVDVVSQVGFIDAGEPIRVVSSSPYRVAVERLETQGAPSGAETA
jgi:membrane-bound ClpP family serine protease